MADAPYVSKRGAIDSDRQVLRATRGFFEGRSTWLVAVVGLSFIAVVGVLDYLTGPNLSLSLLYLMPIGLVTWNLGRRWGAFVVVVATLAGLVSDLLSIPKSGAHRAQHLLERRGALRRLHGVRDAAGHPAGRSSTTSGAAWSGRPSARADLRELNDQKDTLLHAVSHDLKSPLAGILGAMQTIRRDAELHLTNEERESLYEVIEQSGRKMNRLIDDLLDLDRIDRGQLRPQRLPTDMGELVRRIVREGNGFGAHPSASRPIRWRWTSTPVKVDRVVDNLLINATRHTPSGTPMLRARHRPGDGVLLIVEDEGPGVPDELKEVLFEPFRQGDESSGRGVGIGLSLVQRFAELHGGSARIEDHDGGGARFVIDLPGRVTPLHAQEHDVLEPVALAGSGS